jgi:hypothetical protein
MKQKKTVYVDLQKRLAVETAQLEQGRKPHCNQYSD